MKTIGLSQGLYTRVFAPTGEPRFNAKTGEYLDRKGVRVASVKPGTNPEFGAIRWTSFRRFVEFLAIEFAAMPEDARAFGFVFHGGLNALRKTYRFGGASNHSTHYWIKALDAGASLLFDFDGGQQFALWDYERAHGKVVIYPTELMLPGFAKHLPEGSPDAKLVPAFDLRRLPSVLKGTRMPIREINLFDRFRVALDARDTVHGMQWTFGSWMSTKEINTVLDEWERAGIITRSGRDITFTRFAGVLPIDVRQPAVEAETEAEEVF